MGPGDKAQRPRREGESDLYLHSIPSRSGWFSWDDIHETERSALQEFFDGSSITRTPKIYKEYRDFIINKFRQNPARRLRFTEIRKSLIADGSLLLKVFRQLENWGLINFPLGSDGLDSEVDDASKVRLEDGTPYGIRVAAMPNILKPMSVPRICEDHPVSVVWGECDLPPLASFGDVFGRLGRKEEAACGSCGGDFNSGKYQNTKDSYIVCGNCFQNGSYGEYMLKDDFEVQEDVHRKGSSYTPVWTEAETLLLLDSILQHGDDWDLVGQNVRTKTKFDCISKFLGQPFGDLTFGSIGPLESRNGSELLTTSLDSWKENEDKMQEQEDTVIQDVPMATTHLAFPSESGFSSLLKQVAFMSTMVGPNVMAAAVEFAAAAICEDAKFPVEIFVSDERDKLLEDSYVMEEPDPPDAHQASSWKIMHNDAPLILCLRAGSATALGVAAAHAKLLADQEDREIATLLAILIETHLKKLQNKVKYMDGAELILDKEYSELQKIKRVLSKKWTGALWEMMNAGMCKTVYHIS